MSDLSQERILSVLAMLLLSACSESEAGRPEPEIGLTELPREAGRAGRGQGGCGATGCGSCGGKLPGGSTIDASRVSTADSSDDAGADASDGKP